MVMPGVVLPCTVFFLLHLIPPLFFTEAPARLYPTFGISSPPCLAGERANQQELSMFSNTDWIS